MEQFVGGIAGRRTLLRVHGQNGPGQQAYPIFGALLFHQNPQILLHHTVLSLTKRVRRVRVGYTCGYLDVQSVQYSLVPSGITPDEWISLGAP